MYWRKQIDLQSRDNFPKRPIESQSLLFPEAGDIYSRTIQCDVSIE